jgi:hypothetical protein
MVGFLWISQSDIYAIMISICIGLDIAVVNACFQAN